MTQSCIECGDETENEVTVGAEDDDGEVIEEESITLCTDCFFEAMLSL